MRIGVNAFPLAVERGGARHALVGLLQALLKVQAEHQYVVFATRDGSDALRPLGAAAGRLAMVPVRDENEILLHRRDFDLYFAPLNFMTPRLNDRPTVAMLHDIQEHYFPEHFSAADLAWRREEYSEIARTATVLVTVSEFCKRTLVAKLNVDEARVRVVYNAPQAGVIDPNGARDEVWTGSPLPTRYLFCPANFHRHKNHALLLDALQRLAGDGGSCPAVVFTGVEFPGGFPLRQEVARRGLQDRCVILSDVSPPQMGYLYRHAAAVVLPTLFEGFGMPAVEAMACGCPVVCSDLPPLREVAQENALYFPPNDVDQLCQQVERVLGDDALRSQLAERGPQIASRFTWEESARRMLAVFGEAQQRFACVAQGARPRIGVVIRGRSDGMARTRASLDAGHYPNLVVREEPDDAGAFASLLRFAQQERLDVVGEVRAGQELTRTALDALACSYERELGKAVHLGEVLELRGRTAQISRVRCIGQGVWKLEGWLHPEMLFVNVRALANWPAGLALAQRAGIDWRWPLLREAWRCGQVVLLRRMLAEGDARHGLAARLRAWRIGMSRYYNAEGRPVRVPLWRRWEPPLRRVARKLPPGMQRTGARLWSWLVARA